MLIVDSISPANVMRFSRGASDVAKRRLVHAMLEGVFQRRNNFFDVRRQLATTLD
ncbi:hypothetical protein BH24ACI5_BH24ACI5_00910 [soil metagenome]